MNKKDLLKVGILMATPVLFSACVDDDYDLTDIDTTAELQVKNLVLPIEIDEIMLKNIIELDDNEQIKIIDDQYVFVEEGNFTSESISIEQVEIDAPVVEPVSSTVNLTGNADLLSTNDFISEVHYPIPAQISNFTYETNNVSDFIVDMDKIDVDFDVVITFSINKIKNSVKSFTLRDFKLQIPKGLTVTTADGVYDAETGIVSIEDKKHYNSEIAFILNITSIDTDKAGMIYNHTNHSVVFADKVGIHSGEIVITDSDFIEGYSFINLPTTADILTEFDLSNILIKTFTGKINYTLEGFEIDPVKFNNVPGVLNQSGTDIRLGNPQIYLKLNNPLAQYSLSAQAGLTITAQRKNSKDQTYSIDNNYFTVAGTPDNYTSTLCLSPAIPDKYYTGYENAEHVPFTSLSNVLSGKGLPKSMLVTIDNPQVPTQQVENFTLGQNIGDITGDYMFYAPFDMKAGTEVVYSYTEKGWNDEDVDAITINLLKVNATITNNLPADITITGYPIDVEGKRINNVTVEGVVIDANAVDQPLNIFITGEITHLDGIYFKAEASIPADNSTLKPSETISLKNIKVTVSGNYIKEL